MRRLLQLLVTFTLVVSFVGVGWAQISEQDVMDDVKRLDVRWFAAYNRAVDGRDFFATIHDSIRHGAYNEMVRAKDRYRAVRNELNKSLIAHEPMKAAKKVGELEAAGKELGDKVEIYMASSSNAVEKIQIGLGVFAFVICGIVYLLFRRRKK